MFVLPYGGLFDHDLDHGVVSSIDEFVISFFFSRKFFISINNWNRSIDRINVKLCEWTCCFF